jgi:hypothetical protein
VTFNASAADQTANYTHIEVQDNAIVNEGKWTNLRLWFADPNHIGVGIDLSGDATRCQLVKPVFENFSGVTGTIGIRYNAAADSGFYFAGRPVFTGAGTYAAKFSNASTKWALGSVSAFRESNTITIGTSGVYSTAATNSSIAEYAGIPSIFVTIGGTVGGSETITVELKIATTADDGTNTYTIEKTYTRAATSTLNIADYLSLTTNNHFYVMQNLQIRAKTSLASTSATVTVGTISASPCTGGDVQLNATNTYGDFSSIFRATRVKIRNPANTFSYTITGAGIAADRAVNLPVLTADDTLTFDAFATTLTNKTVNATNNTITDTSTATGDLLVSNGTKFVRRAKGTGLQYLRTNSGATDLEWGTLDSEKVGKSTASGNGSTTIFNIPHGLGSNPTYAYVDCSSIVNTYTYTTDATNIVVTFTPTAPPSGTNNVVIYWRVVA